MNKKLKNTLLILGGIASIATIVGVFWPDKSETTNISSQIGEVNNNSDTDNSSDNSSEINNSNTTGDNGINISGNNNTVNINNPEPKNKENGPEQVETTTSSHKAKKKVADNSIAVLPFKVISKNKEDEWLENGIPEGLINELLKVDSLIFLERNLIASLLEEINLEQTDYFDESASAELGHLLGVKTIVLGSCQILNNQVFLTSRIVNVESGVIDNCCVVEDSGLVEDIFQIEKQLAKKIKTCIQSCK